MNIKNIIAGTNKRMKYLLIILLIIGCYKVEPNYLLITNKYNQIDIFEVGEVIPENYSIINEFFIGPYNYDLSSFNADEDCSLVTVLNQAKKEAIDLGGNALKIITLKEPTVGNPCYTIKALALIKNNK